jgi:hypothetical protein
MTGPISRYVEKGTLTVYGLSYDIAVLVQELFQEFDVAAVDCLHG